MVARRYSRNARTAWMTPRRPSSIQAWSAPVRNNDWVAALIGLG
jgi:hypothetical protein